MIIGVTGTLGAGKTEIANLLIDNEFHHFSFRSFLIEELTRRGLPTDREHMVRLANQLRKEMGDDYIIGELCKRAEHAGGNSVIESIRCKGEVDFLRTQRDFYLVSTDANQEERYDRVVRRGCSTDRRTFQQFVEDEEKEMHSDNPWDQNISECMAMADYAVFNSGSDLTRFKDELTHGRKGLLNLFPKFGGVRRPSPDEKYMKHATIEADGSTCLRRHVGAVLAIHDVQIAQGYNGAPRGLKHCAETGCERERQGIPSGQRHEVCRGVHAEANAIVNAGRSGIPAVDATLYCTNNPCVQCAKLIINAGIGRVVYHSSYPDPLAIKMLGESSVKYEKHAGVTPQSYGRFWKG